MNLRSYIDVNAAMAHRKPTEAQKAAGNYPKGHIRFNGLDIAIENARGSVRHGVGSSGKPWRVRMPAHYGYAKGTTGADKDHVDVYIGPQPKSENVFVIDQMNADTGKFDEHKVMLGFGSKKQALNIYKAGFSDGKGAARIGHVAEMDIPGVKAWLKHGDTAKPVEKFADGGAVHMASGGALLSDDDIGLGGGALLSDADMGVGPSPKQTSQFSWSDVITDIPGEIGHAAGEAWQNLKGVANRGQQGSFEGLLNTGKAALAIPQMIWSPAIGTARSIGGHSLANAEHAIGSMIAPEIAAKDDPKAMYERAKGDVDTAMSALAAKRAPAPVAPQAVPKPSTIGDFNVPLTAGEATADFGKIAEERAALRGGRGDRAQNVAENFMGERNAALEEARSGIGKDMDRFGQHIVSDPSEAAALTTQTLKDQAAAAKQRYGDLYAKAFDQPGEIHAGAFEGIEQKIKGDLSLGDNPVIIDDRTTPFASRALQDIDENISRLKIQNKADPFGQPAQNNIVGVNLKGVDQTRKRLLSFARDAKKYPPDADTRATQAIVSAFDKQVEGAITRGLFSGDDRTLQYLKEARNAYSEYRKAFTPQGPGDDVGRTVQKILGRGVEGQEATPTEVSNYLYGSANVGSKGLSARLAQRLKEMMGDQSPEWDGVRQGLWSRLTQSTEGRTDWGPQKVSERISEFINGAGKPLAESMFSPTERDVMTSYSELLKKLVPPPGAVNYSNNLPMLNRIAEGMDKHVGTVIGAKIGGIPGALAGYAAGKGTSIINQVMSARRIAKLMPTLSQSLGQWQRAQAAAIRGKSPSTPALVTASTNLARMLQNFGFDYAATLRQLQGAMPAGAQDEQPKP